MTRTFERFLRSFSDEELRAFALDREAVRPPYWKVLRLALRIEAARRGLRLDEELAGLPGDGVDARPGGGARALASPPRTG